MELSEFFDIMAHLPESSIEAGDVRGALRAVGPLPRFLRALLVTDGTVTMALEAYFSERIKISTQSQYPETLPQAIPALHMKAQDQYYFRQVQLLGEDTGTCYASAVSILNKNAIGDELFEQLVDEHIGIGVILRNSAKGSFREVLSVRRGGLLAGFDVHRSYRVSLNSVPSILINEEFPLAPYQLDEDVR